MNELLTDAGKAVRMTPPNDQERAHLKRHREVGGTAQALAAYARVAVSDLEG
jgi:hypothetical protein